MEISNNTSCYTFHAFDISRLDERFIETHAADKLTTDLKGYLDVFPQQIEVNSALFTGLPGIQPQDVSVYQDNGNLFVCCGCGASNDKLCSHQSQALYNIYKRPELRIFFDSILRINKLRDFALPYGLQQEKDVERFFNIEYRDRKFIITPVEKSVFAVTKDITQKLQEQLLLQQLPQIPYTGKEEAPSMFVVLKRHKYYRHLCIELYEAAVTKAGKIKNPCNAVNPLDFIWKTDDHKELKFFTGITRFQNNHSTVTSAADLDALKAIVKNPQQLDFYSHNSDFSENIVAGSLNKLFIGEVLTDVKLTVKQEGLFYHIEASVVINKQLYALKELALSYDYFILIENRLHLIGNFQLLKVLEFLKQHQFSLLVHASKYAQFQQEVLAKLEDRISIHYAERPVATPGQAKEKGFDKPTEKLVYLSDLPNYIMIQPVMRYGNVEIPVLTKRQVWAKDNKGDDFTIERDDAAELALTELLLKQHDDFYEQLDGALPYFYLHRKRFLEEDWFLTAFEHWQQHGVTVLGFNQLKGNKLNGNKVSISIIVTSGTNWFNTDIKASFGKAKASLKQLKKSVLNRNKYVQLDDGTMGILPAEWMDKFAAYFNAGEVIDESLLTAKINYASIADLYEEELLSNEVKVELKLYQTELYNFESIKEIEIPKDLNATLRHYQYQGLNWLNMLDEFGFGGCLADDMGLGKSIQVIAFILSQRNKQRHNTNLVVVPTSLLFNWQAEINKFAPSIKIHTYYGAGRAGDGLQFNDYEVVLTTYGMLVADINVLKAYKFNYVFLDESQQIKNPESQRYSAAMLLKSYNRIVITGTPVENNTFDLFGQLSFACPGLLGNKRYFRDIYSIPIDKFKDSRRAAELKHKVQPFILRRTKKQVATELPDKTEMVIYCEMSEAQQKVYDAYETEFREFISAQNSDELPKNAMYVLKGLTRLRQICNSPLLLAEEKLYDDSSAKIDVLMEQVESKSAGHKILIFSQFVSMLNLIRKALEARNIDFEYLTGATKNREAVVNSFQQNEAKRVFLVSLKAGGTGLNLTEADYVFLVDPWWNPAVENQAIDRCYRIGQQKHVMAVRLICPGTVEEKIMKLQESKKELVEDIIQADNSFFKSMSKAELLGLVGK